MRPIPFTSEPLIRWPRLQSGATVRWPFLLAALLTILTVVARATGVL